MKLSTVNPRYEDVPLNIPPFQWSPELSYWDATMGALSVSNRRFIWLSLALVSTVVTIIVGFVFTAILIKPEARRKPYNLFLVFLMIPDIIFSVADPPIYLLNHVAGKYVSVEACKIQGFMLSFGGAANCQINALIALEIHQMLSDSYGRKRYFPPSAWQVAKRCIASYLLVASVCLVFALNFENLPLRVFLTGGGAYCSPAPYNTNSALAFYLGLISIGLFIPLGICVLVTLDVLRRGLLPQKGEAKRVLTLFFFRLLVVLAVFWAPSVIAIFVNSNPWLAYSGGLWSHLQGAVSTIAMALGKKDVGDCVKDLWDRLSCGLLYSQTESGNNETNLAPTTVVQRATEITIREMDDFTEDETDTENPCLQDVKYSQQDNLPTVFENEMRQTES